MTMSEHPIDFGRYLQTCRQKQGMSLVLLSKKTKISMSCLRQIENEDWENLPAATFVKGFIRAYAKEVGADIEDALRRYETGRLIRQQLVQSQIPKAQGTDRFWSRIVLAVCLLAALFGATIYITRQMDRPPETSVEEGVVPSPGLPLVSADGIEGNADSPQGSVSSPEIESFRAERPSEPAPSATPPEGPAPQPAVTARATDPATQPPREKAETEETPMAPEPQPPLVLNIIAVETTWLRIAADQGAPREMTLRQGHEVTMKAESGFHLHIGNAGGLRLSLNGQPISVPGRSGQVVTLQLP